MSKKKPAKAKKSVRSLKAKSLSAKEARGVKGGVHNIDKASPVLLQYCANGTHMKE